ncbi:CheR family methyltransferase [Vulgatibacter sp.]|uniref:CheR family methyltransferase n=1 Tax=Vulgatibacter sp. TaxID=1971226 RepID=UPI003567933C
MRGLETRQLQQLAGLLHEKVGLHVRPDAWGNLRLAVSARLGAGAPTAHIDEWLGALAQSEEELRRLLPLVTVGKTSFFRDDRQFAALSELLPDWLAAGRAAGRRLSIWSAGCATGEEIHSIAIAALEAGAEPPELELLGTDVNPAAVAFAAAGRYPLARLEGLSADRIERHFRVEDGVAQVRPALRRAAPSFEVQNLADDRYPQPRAGSWDVIFCRNVLIYFDLPTTMQVLDRFHRALKPGGFLFLGYSESLFRVYDGFELVERAGAFFYRKPHGAARRGAAGGAAAAPSPDEPPVLAPSPARETPPPGPPTLREIAVGIEAGRFEEARRALEERVEKVPEDLGARLTLANLLVLLRLPAEARACYEAALEMEPLRAEVHLLFGIHLHAQGDWQRAAEEFSRALFLEPELALGHWFLGRCRERAGDLEGARRAYRNAVRTSREGRQRRRFLGFYPDLPEDDGPFARAAESALQAL